MEVTIMDSRTYKIILVLIVLGAGFYAMKNGYVNLSALTGTPGGNGNMVKVSGIVNYVTNQTSASGTVYIREKGSDNFETVTISSGAFTSALMYEAGETLELQFHPTGCYVSEAEVIVPNVDASRDTVSIGSFGVYPIDTSVSLVILDQNGNKLDGSNSYNYTSSGTTLRVTVQIAVGTSDTATGLPAAYTDWASGDSYRQGFISIKIGDSDASDFVPQTYDDSKTIGSYIYYNYNTPTVVDDSDLSTDGIYAFSITIDINGAATFSVYYYDMMEVSDYAVMNVGTADASVANIGVVA